MASKRIQEVEKIYDRVVERGESDTAKQGYVLIDPVNGDYIVVPSLEEALQEAQGQFAPGSAVIRQLKTTR